MKDDPILFAWMTEDGKWLCRDDVGNLTTTDQLNKALVLPAEDALLKGGSTDTVYYYDKKLLRLRVRETRSVKIHEDQLYEM